jgi:SAM-dependent methyltransferase
MVEFTSAGDGNRRDLPGDTPDQAEPDGQPTAAEQTRLAGEVQGPAGHSAAWQKSRAQQDDALRKGGDVLLGRSFGQDARAYDTGRRPIPFADSVLNQGLKGIPEGGTMLEPGAGTGRGTKLVLDKRPDLKITCLEPDPAMRVVLAENLGDQVKSGQVKIVAGSAENIAEKLALGDVEEVDAIAFFDAYHWVERGLTDRQLHHALKPNGRLISFNNLLGKATVADALMDALKGDEDWLDTCSIETNGAPRKGEWGEPFFKNFTHNEFAFDTELTSQEVWASAAHFSSIRAGRQGPRNLTGGSYWQLTNSRTQTTR